VANARVIMPTGSGASGTLARTLEDRLRRPSSYADRVRGTVTLDAGPDDVWTIRLRGTAEAVLERGIARAPTATVTADPETMHAVMKGEISGLDAFMAGKLGVRGHVGLALKLDLFFPPRVRPPNGMRPGVTIVDDVETFYLDAGPRDAPVVLLLHGLGATNVSMVPLMAELSRDHRVIAIDLPGFGESGKPVRPYHFAYYAKFLVGFMDRLGIAKASAIGNSMGGRISIELGLRAPERVDKLVLLAPSMAWRAFRQFVPLVNVLRPELGAIPIVVPRLQVITALKMLFARPERLPQTWLDAAADEFLHVFSSPRGRIGFFSAARQIYLEESHGERGFWDRLPRLRAPSLFVWGDKDWLVPKKFARHVVDAVPHATSVVLDDCGHVPQYETMERVNPLVRDFLTG
jgi:pimeloyl-ACP methyl ester carboxylesterase